MIALHKRQDVNGISVKAWGRTLREENKGYIPHHTHHWHTLTRFTTGTLHHTHHWHTLTTLTTGTPSPDSPLAHPHHTHHWYTHTRLTTGTPSPHSPLAHPHHTHHWHTLTTLTTGTPSPHSPLAQRKRTALSRSSTALSPVNMLSISVNISSLGGKGGEEWTCYQNGQHGNSYHRNIDMNCKSYLQAHHTEMYMYNHHGNSYTRWTSRP